MKLHNGIKYVYKLAAISKSNFNYKSISLVAPLRRSCGFTGTVAPLLKNADLSNGGSII